LDSSIYAQFIVNVFLADYEDVYLEIIDGEGVYIYDTTIFEGVYAYNHGIAPKNMGVEMQVTIYGTKDGVKYRGQTETWSLKTGIMDILESVYDENNDEEGTAMCTLLVDMLYYGAAAQTHFGTDKNGLVTDGLEEKYVALRTTEEPVFEAVNTAPIVNYHQLLDYALGLEDAVQMQFFFWLPQADNTGYSIRVTFNGEAYVYTPDMFADLGDESIAAIVFDKLDARSMRVEMTAELLKDGACVSDVYTASIEGTAESMLGGENEALVKAMMVYGDSAARYLNMREA
jgi:hypothetical protein